VSSPEPFSILLPGPVKIDGVTTSAPPATSSFSRFLAPIGLLALMWAIQFADAVLPGSFTGWGLRSWDLGSLQGLVLGPLLHASWAHLIANSVPLLVLGCLVAVEGARRFWLVTAVVALIGGVGTWLINAPGTLTVGASVLVFGYFGYVVLRVIAPGRLAHRLAYAAIAVIVVVLYGATMLAGILGAAAGVSWQAHLFGAVGGGVLAVTGRRREPAA
jgi:membrane associated rhomboid family serine protease